MSDGTLFTDVGRPEPPDSVADLKAMVTAVLVRATVLLVAATWIVFWGLVIRIHVLQGQYLAAGVVGLIFVVPAIFGLGAYFDPLPHPVGWLRRYGPAIPRLT